MALARRDPTAAAPTPPAESAVWRARVDLAAAHRMAVIDELHEATWNHFSTRMPGYPERFLISPPSVHWSLVDASSLVERGPESQAQLEASGGLAWVAYCIHAPVLWARPDVAAVLHVHSPHIVALSMLETPRLEAAEQSALDFHGRVSVSTRYDGEMPAGLGHGEELARDLGDRDVLIMRHHGAIVVGKTLAEAYTDVYALERAARALILALSTGRALRCFPDEVAARLTAGGKSAALKLDHFAAMKRLLDAREPDYAA